MTTSTHKTTARQVLYSAEPFVISVEAMVGLILNGMIVDGRAGGLVYGRTHANGDVNMIMQSDEVFTSHYCLEGGEYILNKAASEAFASRLSEINNCYIEGFEGINLNLSPVRTLVTFAEPHDKFLFIDAGQFIVNRYATSLHLEELEKMNEAINCYTKFNMDEFLCVDKKHTEL